ncbi:Putative Cell division cycle protein [Septoria linicola]|uniref:Cell division cycle protein n=1 Tax=Septoria linicola TaxID=215465 RepID=A0A9Q9AVR3_9PEZI|nr:Putative Cell division cycle protein [Septoria linicola]
MPHIMDGSQGESDDAPTTLPFPPVTKSHILNCSYHSWHPKYRTLTPKTRLVPLTRPFVDYLRADGIILPEDEDPPVQSDTDSAYVSASDNPDAQDHDDEDDEDDDPSAEWRDVHRAIRATIAELDGAVMPKLNWSAPKDATYMNANTMKCHKPSDIYLLLKSSDFITHDLDHAYDDCVDTSNSAQLDQDNIPYHLVLRKANPHWNPSVEFRCFVRDRKLLCISQRDMNYYSFLHKMQDKLQYLIKEFFEIRLRDTFDDDNFVFDVYIPQTYDRVWLVDINPWAMRTDPLLFSWQELLEMDAPLEEEDPLPDQFVRISFDPAKRQQMLDILAKQEAEEAAAKAAHGQREEHGSESDDEESGDEELYLPELRLVHQDDPEAALFSSSQYSAHKMPRDVVDASQSGNGLADFAREWEKILGERQRADAAHDSADDDD